MWRSVAIVVYTQYVTGQPVSNLATVLNRLSSGQASRRRARLLEDSSSLSDPTGSQARLLQVSD